MNIPIAAVNSPDAHISVAVSEQDAPPAWARRERRSEPESRAEYRGLVLIVSEYGWQVLGRWGGYQVSAIDFRYGADTLTPEANEQAAVAAADDLIEKGWLPR